MTCKCGNEIIEDYKNYVLVNGTDTTTGKVYDTYMWTCAKCGEITIKEVEV